MAHHEVFESQARLHGRMLGILLVILIPSLGLSVWAIAGAVPAWATLAYAVVLTAFLAWLLTMKVHLRVSDSAVEIRTLGFFHESLALDRITGVEPGPNTGLKEGAGLRLLGNATGYLVGGPTVAIHTGRSRYLVSVPDPHAATEAIRRRLEA